MISIVLILQKNYSHLADLTILPWTNQTRQTKDIRVLLYKAGRENLEGYTANKKLNTIPACTKRHTGPVLVISRGCVSV